MTFLDKYFCFSLDTKKKIKNKFYYPILRGLGALKVMLSLYTRGEKIVNWNRKQKYLYLVVIHIL